MRRHDWPKWKEAMDAELESFYRPEVWKYAKLPLKADEVQVDLCVEVRCQWDAQEVQGSFGF